VSTARQSPSVTLPTIETAALTQRRVMPATVAMFFLAGLLTFIVAGMIAGFTGHSDVPGGLLVGIAVAGGLVGAGGSYSVERRSDRSAQHPDAGACRRGHDVTHPRRGSEAAAIARPRPPRPGRPVE